MQSIKELGERKAIEIILKNLEPMPDLPVPFGDDVSAIAIDDRRLVVIKTDMLVGKTDVPPQMSLWQAARKAVVMNISDLAAKGVKPIALLVAFGLPRDLARSDIEQIARGLNAGAREYDAYVLGGDTGEASDLVITCAAFGLGEKDRLMLRSGAHEGDIVAVTGAFGKSAAGLRLLQQSLPTLQRLKKALIDSVLMPQARLSEGLTLAQTGTVTASIDSSDGLAWSLHEISKASGVGFVIDHLPMAEEAKEFADLHGFDPVDLCLYGGEEYELLVTVKPSLLERERKKTPLIRIGHVTREKSVLLKLEKKKAVIEPRGWEHFKSTAPT